MKIVSLVALYGMSTMFCVGVSATAFAQDHHVVVQAQKVQWGPAPPILPPGAQLAVLEGNPGEKGSVVMRLKLPANYVVPPHWHSMTERITVISGTFYVGMGDALDRAASEPLAAGGFVSLPAKMHHYAWVKAPSVVQINLDGPFDLFYLNAADDPQKKPVASSTKR
jgi:hypothetical protein